MNCSISILIVVGTCRGLASPRLAEAAALRRAAKPRHVAAYNLVCDKHTKAQTDCLHVYINVTQPVEDMLSVVVQYYCLMIGQNE